MRSLEDLRQRWQITTSHTASLDILKKSVRADGDESPCVAGLRSVCWKAFLLFQDTDITGWSRVLQDSRSAYSSLRAHLLRVFDNPDELASTLDPLDDDKNSPWNTLRHDEEIRAEIFQDVERCMPEEPYFRKPETQRILLDILFIFCKINQDVGYRQGMHELLAPILWVVEQDALKEIVSGVEAGSEPNSMMKEVLDSAFIEHDAFTLLSLVMRTAKSFYELGEPDRKTTASTGPGSPPPGASPIVERSKRIHEVYLARLDPELAKHLTDIEVLPQIFLIRWIRLLFGREFPFDDLLELWDILLAEDPGLDLVDMVCVAMLLRIRWQLIESNYSMALMLLLKYPAPTSPDGPKTFVDDAIYLRDNFSAAGGIKIIQKYSGKTPRTFLSSSRPTTPLGQALSPRRPISRNRSPLPSPAQFLQRQGGVEALFQGAAKGVFDRGERLGINQAVRDAVGEVKKNMQGLQASRNNSMSRRTSDITRWSLDEGKQVTTSRASVGALNARNIQLAGMLEQAMNDLRAASTSTDGDKETYVKAMDIAIAKVEFVKVYLEDSTMPLPEEPPKSQSPPAFVNTPQPPPVMTPEPATSPTRDSGARKIKVERKSLQSSPIPDNIASQENSTSSTPIVIQPKAEPKPDPPSGGLSARPKAPVPTRSTIAQSSFSWMLEPDTPSSSSPPKSSSPFQKSGKKAMSGSGREKAGFLFGDDGGESKPSNAKLASLVDDEDTFNLGTIRGSRTK